MIEEGDLHRDFSRPKALKAAIEMLGNFSNEN